MALNNFVPIIVPTSSREVCPSGIHQATCTLITYEEPRTDGRYYNPKNPKDICRLGFEITDVTSSTGMPFLPQRMFTALMTPESALYAAMEQALNVCLTPQQAANFNLVAQLLDKPFQVVIQHQEKGGHTYANIARIQPALPGQVPTHQTPLIVHHYRQPDPQMWSLKEQYWPHLTPKSSMAPGLVVPSYSPAPVFIPPSNPFVTAPAVPVSPVPPVSPAVPVTPVPNPAPVSSPVAQATDQDNPFAPLNTGMDSALDLAFSTPKTPDAPVAQSTEASTINELPEDWALLLTSR